MMKILAFFAIVAQLMFAEGIMVENEVFESVPMGDTRPMTLRMSFDETKNEEENWNTDHGVMLTFNLTDKVSWAFNILNDSLVFTFDEIRRRRPKNLYIKGVIIGFNNLEIYGHIVNLNERPSYNDEDNEEDLPPIADMLSEEERMKKLKEKDHFSSSGGNEGQVEDVNHHVELSKQERVLMKEVNLYVVVKSRFLPDLFTLVMTLMVIINTVNMGGQLDLEVIKEVFKSPIGPAVGFLSQFILMPLFSFGIGWLMTSDKLFRLGLFVLGCCPGGTASNFWCILLNGDINLSITMTFISTIAALGMMPLWMFLMGPLLTDGSLVIPYGQLIMTLIFLIAPLSLGMWIRYRWSHAAPIMDKIIVPFTLFTVAFIFTVGVYVNLFIFRLIDWKMVMAGFMVAGAGYFFGGFLAWILRLKRPQITAVSIETAFQNGGIAFILLKVSFPEPFGELATVAPVAQLCITGLPLWAFFLSWKLYSKVLRPFVFGKKKIEEDVKSIDEIFDDLKHDIEDFKDHHHFHHHKHDDEEGKPLEDDKSSDTQFLHSKSVMTTETDIV